MTSVPLRTLVTALCGGAELLAGCSARLQQRAHEPWHGLSAEELAETFSPQQIYAGIRISREECARRKFAVWVEHQYGTECIRYYPSSKVQDASRVVFYFHADVLDGKEPLPDAFINNTVAGKLKEAQDLANVNQVPFVVVARPGTFG